MSPEQCRGERDLTFRSDLYSLGVMFYELVTGSKPFKADNPMDMFMLHVQGSFERPSRLVLDIPVWFDNLICQLLEKKPEQRPRDATMVAETLDRIKEKVEAQRSAGVDVVKGRASERPRLDEEDREAARTLLGKKKKKKKGRPFYQQVWFKGAVYSALLVAILAVFYVVFIKRPSAEALLAQAEEARTGDLEKRVEARNKVIADFLRYYPEHEKAAQVRQWADEIDREKLEHDLVDRHHREVNINVSAEEERARKAMKEEESGNLEAARKAWEAFLVYKGSADAEKHSYALLADDRIKTLDGVKAEEARLAAHVTKEGPLPAFKARDEREAKAAEALKEELNDAARGRKAWTAFQTGLDRDNREHRLWLLLAARHLNELPAPPPPAKKESDQP
jgi:serine/threonine-protein kinase